MENKWSAKPLRKLPQCLQINLIVGRHDQIVIADNEIEFWASHQWAGMEILSEMENYIRERCSDNCGDMYFPFGIQGHSGKQASR